MGDAHRLPLTFRNRPIPGHFSYDDSLRQWISHDAPEMHAGGARIEEGPHGDCSGGIRRGRQGSGQLPGPPVYAH